MIHRLNFVCLHECMIRTLVKQGILIQLSEPITKESHQTRFPKCIVFGSIQVYPISNILKIYDLKAKKVFFIL